MDAGKDPRPDQQADKSGKKPYQDTGESKPFEAPGGVGTGTEGDPAEHTPEKDSGKK